MDLGLAGRRALVTAASKGLGRACAQALAAEGARLVVSAREEATIAAAAREVGSEAHVVADVSRAAEVEALVAEAAGRLGGLDILVVNAGGPPPGNFQSTDDGHWEQANQLTLMSCVRLVRSSLSHLRASEQGRIVIITSISVRQPIGNLVLSNAYRGGVTGLAKTLSFELAPDGITVNCIAPDAILTDRIRQLEAERARAEGIPPDQAVQRRRQELPLRRFGEPIELGWLCAFLCSARAGYITGQTIGIDGGTLRGVH
jgi:3-oxoacyl-[acyl-carrier protein] reductase